MLQEHDAMICRSCGLEERASEGYPCANCGTFICVLCNLRGVTHCRECAKKMGVTPPESSAYPPLKD